MKRIAIPVNDDKKTVCPTFGRAPFFMIYDAGSDEKSYRDNSAADAQGGAGIKAAQFVVDCDVDAIITPRCGVNSAEVLKDAEISIYKSEGDDADLNIEMLKENRLSPLENFHAGYHGIK